MNSRPIFAKIFLMVSMCLGMWVPTFADTETKYFIRFSVIDAELEQTTERFDSLMARHLSLGAVEETFADFTDSGVKLADAIMIHRFIALELGIAYYGQYTMSAITNEARYDIVSKMYGVQGGFSARFPLGMVTFYAKLSGNYWREEFEIRGPDPTPADEDDGEGGDGDDGDGTSHKDFGDYITLEDGGTSGVDFSGEVGLELRLTYGLDLCVSYEQTAINSVDVTAIMVGLTYKY